MSTDLRCYPSGRDPLTMKERRMMSPEIKAEWTSAIRKMPYGSQSFSYLGYRENGQNKFSVLGVLCVIGVDHGIVGSDNKDRDTIGMPLIRFGANDESMFLPEEVLVWAGLEDRGPQVSGLYISGNATMVDDGFTLFNLNRAGSRFWQLADFIDEQL